MKKYIFLAFISLFSAAVAKAQKIDNPKTQQLADLSFAFGNKQGSIVAGYFYNWNLGKSKRFFIGTGARLTSNFGKGSLYTSAPSDLAGDVVKTDTLFTTSPTMVGMNVLLNLGYNITPKLQAGFNIDVIGFTVGSKSEPRFTQNPVGYLVGDAKPTAFNILLVGNNDRGTLNSEFYARYKITNKFGAKLAYQYLFTELTTNTKVQTVPVANDRFRNKASLINVGFSYHF
jgi:hypothetical protein